MEVPGSGRQLEGVITDRFGNAEQVLDKIGSAACRLITQSPVFFFPRVAASVAKLGNLFKAPWRLLGQHHNGRLAAPCHPLGFSSQSRIHHGAKPVLGVLQLPRSHFHFPG